MVMELVGAAGVDDQCALRVIGPPGLTSLTGILKKPLTEGTELACAKRLVWIVAISSIMSAASEHVPRPMPRNTSCQVAVAFVLLMGFWETNGFFEAACYSLLEFAKGR